MFFFLRTQGSSIIVAVFLSFVCLTIAHYECEKGGRPTPLQSESHSSVIQTRDEG